MRHGTKRQGETRGTPAGLFVIVAILAAAALPSAWGQGHDPDYPAVLRGYRDAVARSGIAGSSLLIVRDGRVAAHETYRGRREAGPYGLRNSCNRLAATRAR